MNNQPANENLKEAQEYIKKLSIFNQTILDNAPISIMVLDIEGNITLVNECFNSFTDNQNPIRKNIYEISFFKREGLTELYRNLMQTGVSFQKNNCKTLNSEDEEIYISITAVAIIEQNEIKGAISMAIDSTDFVMASNKLEAANRELEEKVKERTLELKKINDDLNYALKLKSQFIADYSHELRTPLTVIQGNIDLVFFQAEKLDQEVIENLSQVKEQARFMTNLMSDLTLLVNMDSNKQELKTGKINLSELLKTIIRSLKIVAEQKNISFDFKKSIDNLEIIGDESQLEILFLNILRNAIKYGKRNGTVKIRMENFFNTVDIYIEDDGIGMAECDLPYIFSRFYRSEHAKSLGEPGSGLGLAICKRIVESHCGTISVKSKFGVGSIFCVHLPLDYRTSN